MTTQRYDMRNSFEVFSSVVGVLSLFIRRCFVRHPVALTTGSSHTLPWLLATRIWIALSGSAMTTLFAAYKPYYF